MFIYSPTLVFMLHAKLVRFFVQAVNRRLVSYDDNEMNNTNEISYQGYYSNFPRNYTLNEKLNPKFS